MTFDAVLFGVPDTTVTLPVPLAPTFPDVATRGDSSDVELLVGKFFADEALTTLPACVAGEAVTTLLPTAPVVLFTVLITMFLLCADPVEPGVQGTVNLTTLCPGAVVTLWLLLLLLLLVLLLLAPPELGVTVVEGEAEVPLSKSDGFNTSMSPFEVQAAPAEPDWRRDTGPLGLTLALATIPLLIGPFPNKS